jgi:hypothetical protein
MARALGNNAHDQAGGQGRITRADAHSIASGRIVLLGTRTGLAEFLRRRWESLQPEDVGLPRGRRRRTSGLRREEVAALCHMSTDYYARIERERGPKPSEQMIGETLRQTPLGIALTGDLTVYSGPARSLGYRWGLDQTA